MIRDLLFHPNQLANIFPALLQNSAAFLLYPRERFPKVIEPTRRLYVVLYSLFFAPNCEKNTLFLIISKITLICNSFYPGIANKHIY